MKKIFLFLAVASLAVTSCRKDDDNSTTTTEVSIETQNSYDDAAIKQFLKDNYFDAKGNIKAFSSTITTDDNEIPLENYSPVTLPSGVVYIVRNTPTNGKIIGATDKIRIMQNSYSYIAQKASDGKISFASPLSFNNTISGSGTPSSDPKYYYTTPEFIKDYNTANSTTYTEAYFVIEGLRDGLQHFQSYEIPDSDNYNLQGVIIVPSRGAFARDAAFPYNGTMTDKSIVFNFQIYKTEAR